MFPFEIWSFIFAFLTPKDVVLASRVCKEFYELCSSFYMWRMLIGYTSIHGDIESCLKHKEPSIVRKNGFILYHWFKEVEKIQESSRNTKLVYEEYDIYFEDTETREIRRLNFEVSNINFLDWTISLQPKSCIEDITDLEEGDSYQKTRRPEYNEEICIELWDSYFHQEFEYCFYGDVQHPFKYEVDLKKISIKEIMGEENVLLSDLMERYTLYHEEDDTDVLLTPPILRKRIRESEDNDESSNAKKQHVE
jgi:hypothetical protein